MADRLEVFKVFWRFLEGFFAALEWGFWDEVELCATEGTEDEIELREGKIGLGLGLGF